MQNADNHFYNLLVFSVPVFIPVVYDICHLCRFIADIVVMRTSLCQPHYVYQAGKTKKLKHSSLKSSLVE